MEWIRITPKNLETEHICCAICGLGAVSGREIFDK